MLSLIQHKIMTDTEEMIFKTRAEETSDASRVIIAI